LVGSRPKSRAFTQELPAMFSRAFLFPVAIAFVLFGAYEANKYGLTDNVILLLAAGAINLIYVVGKSFIR
jgi:hypothetical protein